MTKEQLLTRTLEDLREIYPEGLYEYLFKYRQEMYERLLLLENRIDQIYLNPNVSIDPLRTVLREYWNLHAQAIRKFQQVGHVNLNLPKARRELAQERIRA